MIREHSTILARFHKVLDIFLVVLSFVIAYQVKRNFVFLGVNRGLSTEPNYYLVLLILVLLAPVVFRLAGFYQSYRTQTYYQIGVRVGKAVVGLLGGVIVLLFLAHESGVSRLLFALFGVALAVMLLLSKSIVYFTLQHYRAKQYNTRNVLIVGTGFRAKRMIKSLQRQKGSGYQIMGYIVPGNNDSVSETFPESVKNLGPIALLPTILLEQVVDEIIFAADLGNIESINEYIQFAEELGINIRIVPDFQLEKIMYHPETASIFMQEFAGMSTIAISTVSQQHGELFIKSCLDYIVAGVGLVLFSPLLLCIALAIKFNSKGPVLFIQERSGIHGRIFNVLKFRTMVENAEELKSSLEQRNEADGPVFKIAKDPRITSLGRFLRKTSLDELPQLANILLGQMSLVGPRPPIPAEVEQYEPWQRRRLSMKPGMTCIWQVCGRNNIDFDHWMQLDLDYIDNWSLFQDIKILLKTIGTVASCNGK